MAYKIVVFSVDLLTSFLSGGEAESEGQLWVSGEEVSDDGSLPDA